MLASWQLWQTLTSAPDHDGDDWLMQRQQTMGIATIALLLHSWIVYSVSGLPNTISLTFFSSLIAVSMVIVLLHIAICLKQPASYLGIVIYPLAAGTLVANLVFAPDEPSTSSAMPFQLHIFLSLLAYSVLALAAAQSGLVALQRHLLKAHRPGGIARALPALDRTEQLLFTLLGVGFVLLTLALLSGFVQLDDMFAQHLVHKTVLSSLAWLTFGVLLLGRWRFGWRGTRAIKLTLAGFAFLILAYFGSKFVLEVLLRRS